MPFGTLGPNSKLFRRDKMLKEKQHGLYKEGAEEPEGEGNSPILKSERKERCEELSFSKGHWWLK